MKTIDLLVQELPTLGGWPDGAVEAGFLCTDDTLFFVNEDGDCPSAWRINMKSGVEDNCIEVTREQYEAALAAKNDGWIEWGGGEYPPVSTNTVVDVKLRCGSVTVRQPAGIVNWRSNAPDEPGDIIAYRLHQMQEADLNECIGQDAAPVWNGEGLPPVGCDVEYHCYPDGWVIINIVARIKGATFIEWKSGTHKGGDVIRGDFPLERVRPLRTEAERAIDEMVRLSGVSIGAAKILYDAGYRKG